MNALRYLLDTNILSVLVRQPDHDLTRRIRQIGENQICTSIVVAAELRYGGRKSGSKSLQEAIGHVLSAICVLDLDEPTDRCYADLRHQLAKVGNMIGPNDLWIAAHALSRDLIVVTANTRAFSRVPGLLVENWISESL